MAYIDKIEYLNSVYDIQDNTARELANTAQTAASTAQSVATVAQTAATNAMTEAQKKGYPATTTFDGSLAWNTEYRMGTISYPSITMVLPNIDTANSGEIRAFFTAGADIALSLTPPSGVTLYGVDDLSITSGNSYEMSIAILDASHISVIAKEYANE